LDGGPWKKYRTGIEGNDFAEQNKGHCRMEIKLLDLAKRNLERSHADVDV